MPFLKLSCHDGDIDDGNIYDNGVKMIVQMMIMLVMIVVVISMMFTTVIFFFFYGDSAVF